MRPILKLALNKYGIQKNLPRKLVYGTLRMRGLQLRDPYWLQLIFHLQAIMRHSHRDTPSNDLLTDNMELVQLYVGSQESFWLLPYQWYGCLAPEGWIQHTWQCYDETPMTLKGPSIAQPPKRRGEIFLSDAFMEAGYSEEQRLILRDCRLRLEVTMLSEIVTADGAYITERAWNGQPSENLRKDRWIKTCRLPQESWDLWQQALRTCFLFPHATHLRLQRRLGPWLKRRDSE